MPEGTLKIGYVLPAPLSQAPDQRITLIQDETPAKTTVRVDVDERLRLHWVRQAPGGEPADVEVDLSPLLGGTRLDIWCTWSPFKLDVHVVNETGRMVTSESTE